jgi:hypothetical protein
LALATTPMAEYMRDNGWKENVMDQAS